MREIFRVARLQDIGVASIDAAIKLAPPSWTRLEPIVASGDPAPGLAAAIHDPLWLLARQWQFGELTGENAGTPLSIDVAADSLPLSAFQAATGETFAFPARHIVDPLVEREPPAPQGPALKLRAEASLLLFQMTEDAGHDVRAELVGRYPIVAPESVDEGGHISLLAAYCADAEAIARSLESGLPDWLAAAPVPAIAAAKEWLEWYRSNVAPPATGDCWLRERMEYRFAMRAGGADGPVFCAPMHEGGEIDWFSFDTDPSRRMGAVDTGASETESAPREHAQALISPLSFVGMASDRLWSFEDGATSFGNVDAQNNELARLCLVEFAMAYSCDWFITPFDVPRGSWTTISRVVMLDSFGDSTEIAPFDDGVEGKRFRMFSMSSHRKEASMEGLLSPPAALSTMEGAPLEHVDFFRDEMANLVWAVERVVQDAAGEPFSRTWEAPAESGLEPLAEADLEYRLSTQIASHWIPLVPVATSADGFLLRKGTMTGHDDSRGQLLAGRPVNILDEEIPREGLRVQRVPCLARDADGTRVRWIARRVGPSFGEGASGLAFDRTIPVSRANLD